MTAEQRGTNGLPIALCICVLIAGAGVSRGQPLQGTAVDEAGVPVGQATVRHAADPSSPSVVTAADGTFVLPVPERHRPYVTLQASAKEGALQGVCDEDLRVTDTCRVVLRPAASTMVTVRDGDGRPVADAASLAMGRGREWAVARTDRNGSAVLRFPADARVDAVVAFRSGAGLDFFLHTHLAGGFRSPDTPFPDQVELTFSGVRTARLHVVDSAGRPVAGVLAAPWISRESRTSGSPGMCLSQAVPTDAAGVATIDWLPLDWVYKPRGIAVLPPRGSGFHAFDYFSRLMTDASGEASPGVLVFRATVFRKARVTGTVILPDGNPGAGVTVLANGLSEGEKQRRFQDETQADTQGKYEFLLAPGLSYVIGVQGAPWASPSRRVAAIGEGERKEGVDFALRQGTHLHGRVRSVGPLRPVHRVITVTETAPAPRGNGTDAADTSAVPLFLRRRAEVAPDGSYELWLPRGRFLVKGPFSPEPKPLLVAAGQEVIRKDFVQEAISGTVTFRSGETAPRATVRARRLVEHEYEIDDWYHTNAGNKELDTLADAQGCFRLLRAKKPLCIYACDEGGENAGCVAVEAGAAEAHVTLAPAGIIEAQVLSQRRPMVGWDVRAELRLEKAAYLYETKTDEDGAFWVPGIVPGMTCHVRVHGPDGETRTLSAVRMEKPGFHQLRTVQVSPGERWHEAFAAVYQLQDGQVLKRIPPPFIPARREYYHTRDRHQARSIDRTPDRYVFHWHDGRLNPWGCSFGTGGALRGVLTSVIQLDSYEFDMHKDVLRIPLRGDWIVRRNASAEERMTALAELVRHSSGRKIRFDERQVERNCLVASGVFLANFLPGEDSIWLYSGTDHPTDDGGGGGGADDVGEFLAEVGDRVGARIVNETEPGTVRRIRYSQRCSAYLARMEDREKRARMLEQLLSNLTAQTGLKFRQAKRPFPVWFAVEAEGGARRQQ